MPIYEYRCERGHTFEVMQRMTDDALTVCDEHGTPVQRVFHPVAVHFKGSGFYNTDYGKKKSGAAGVLVRGGLVVGQLVIEVGLGSSSGSSDSRRRTRALRARAPRRARPARTSSASTIDRPA